jgi:hypothetical protein
MHATIAWNGTSSLSAGNLTLAAEDIIAILTGETDKNNLSAMNLPGGTSIASSYPAGWEIWDDDTGTINEWVLRAPTIDDAAQYKYVRIRFYTSSAYLYLESQLMEDWNPATNTATNACTTDAVNLTRFPTNSYSNGTTEVVATARYIFVRANIYALTYAFPCIEITRVHPSLEIGSGRVPAVQLQNNGFGATNMTTYYAAIPRILDDAGTADLLAQDIRCINGGGRPSTNISNEFDNLAEEIAYDDSNNPSYGIQQILFERRELIGQVCGDSIVSGVFLMQGGVVTGFEDRTLHTLDSTDDVRCLWLDTSQTTTHGNNRIIIQAE